MDENDESGPKDWDSYFADLERPAMEPSESTGDVPSAPAAETQERHYGEVLWGGYPLTWGDEG